MLFKDVHSDISRYLEEDCYCPNEVYSIDGFFFVLIKDDAESELLDRFEKDGEQIYLVATTDTGNNPYLVTVWVTNDRVKNIERYDLTAHNICAIRDYFIKDKKPIRFSEEMKLENDVKKILSVADAVLVD